MTMPSSSLSDQLIRSNSKPKRPAGGSLWTGLVLVLLLINLIIVAILLLFTSSYLDTRGHYDRSYPASNRPEPLVVEEFTKSFEYRSKTAQWQLKRIQSQIQSKLSDYAFQQTLHAPLSSSEARELDQLTLSLTDQDPSEDNRIDSNLHRNRFDYNPKAEQIQKAWSRAQSSAHARQLMPKTSVEIDLILRSLQHAPIRRADSARRGTQLKFLLSLEGQQLAYFKPLRYSNPDMAIDGPANPYSGYDRYNGEIVAFHLSRILNMPMVPFATGRRLHLEKEVRAVGSARLLKTFLNESCLYGDCPYCRKAEFVCSDPSGYMAGVVILLLTPPNVRLTKLRNPWQRTYRNDSIADWQIRGEEYCERFLADSQFSVRLLDLIDTSIFDFLIGNADRHHYEVLAGWPNSSIVLLDNGKSLGNSEHDELSILAPLYQCCLVRRQTLRRLRLLRLELGDLLDRVLRRWEILNLPMLTDRHRSAIERRVRTVLATVDICVDRKNLKSVIV